MSTTNHVLAFCALGVNLLLGGILVEETFGAIWRDVFEFVLIGLYLVVVWGMPGSLRPPSDEGPQGRGPRGPRP